MNITSVEDVFHLTDEEVAALFDALYRRQVMKDAEAKIEEVTQEYLDARDGHQPDPSQAVVEDYPEFKKPSGAHDAYVAGRIIRSGDRLFRANLTTDHSPDEHPPNWTEVFLVDGEITTQRPVNPDTGVPDYPTYDPSETYYQNPSNTPLVIVDHGGKLWELVHNVAAPNSAPDDPAMWAIWREYREDLG